MKTMLLMPVYGRISNIRNPLRLFFILLSSAFITLPAVAAEINTTASEPAAYVIGPQNVIQIKIFGDGSTNQIYRVDESGTVKHALIGNVKLGGLTIAEAENLMEERLSGDYIINPHVNIFVLEYSRFSIIGEVVRPGTYEITGQVSIIQAIALAGGFSRVANARGVKIVRKKEGSEITIPVDTTRITERGDRRAEANIEANDVIVVPKSFF